MTDATQTALIVAVPPTILALGSLVRSIKNGKDIKEVHLMINSRMDDLLKLTKSASFAAGEKAEKDKPSTKNDSLP